MRGVLFEHAHHTGNNSDDTPEKCQHQKYNNDTGQGDHERVQYAEHLGTHARSEEDVLSYIAFPQQAEQFFERREQTFTASYSFKEVK